MGQECIWQKLQNRKTIVLKLLHAAGDLGSKNGNSCKLPAVTPRSYTWCKCRAVQYLWFVNLCNKTSFSLKHDWNSEQSHHMSAFLPRLLCIVFVLFLNILNTIFFIWCVLTLLAWKHETTCRSAFYPIQSFFDSFKLVAPVKGTRMYLTETTKQKNHSAKVAARSRWSKQQKREFL